MITWKVTLRDKETGNEHAVFIAADTLALLTHTRDYAKVAKDAEVIAAAFWERNASNRPDYI